MSKEFLDYGDRVAPLQTKHTLERGQLFLELITRISTNDRAIALSLVSQFELFDYSDYKTKQDGVRRHVYTHSVRYLQESGETWQFIVESQKDRRGYAYLAPRKAGNRAFLPSVPSDIRKAIGDRYGVDVPLDGSFWAWLNNHPEIPIVITEGGGKALSGLSHGFVVIGLYGCSCLRSPDLEPYIKGRDIAIAFDCDIKASAVKAVNNALYNHLPSLSNTAKSVKVLTWNKRYKGLDDLLASGGITALETALETALNGETWLNNRKIAIAHDRLEISKIKGDLELDALPSPEYLQALLDKHRDVFLVAPKGLGKSILGGAIVRNADYALIPTPLESLAKNNAERMSQGDRIVDYRTDCDRVKGQLIGANGYVNRLAFCVEAIQGLKGHTEPCLTRGATVFNDELDLQLNSLATSTTHSENGKRRVNQALYWDMQMRAKQTLSVSADLTNYEAELWERKTGRKPFVIKVKAIKKAYSCKVFGNKIRVKTLLDQAIKNGDREIVCCSRKSDAKFFEWLYRDYGAIAIHRDNANEPKFDGFFNNPNQWLLENKPQILIVSPVLRSGFSITGNFFDKVFCFFEDDSISASTALQLSERYRLPVPRFIYAAETNGQYRHCTAANILKTRKGRALASGTNEIEFIDDNDPYFHYKSADNWSKAHFKADIVARLQDEVETVEIDELGVSPDESKEFSEHLKAFKAWQQQKLYESRNLSQADYESMKDRRDLLESDLLAVEKYRLANWSDRAPDTVTIEQIKRDNKGSKRKALERLERQAYSILAVNSDRHSIEVQNKWGYGIAHQDVSHFSLAQQAIEQTGFHGFLDYALSGAKWQNETEIVANLGSKLRSLRNFEQIRIGNFGKAVVTKIDKLAEIGINLMCGRDASNTGYIGSLLKWLGLITKRTQKRVDGQVISFYELCPDDLAITRHELTRRASRMIREGLELIPSHAFVDRIIGVSHTFSNSPIQKVCDSTQSFIEHEVQIENIPTPLTPDIAIAYGVTVRQISPFCVPDIAIATTSPAPNPSPNPMPKNDYEGETIYERIARLSRETEAYCKAKYEAAVGYAIA